MNLKNTFGSKIRRTLTSILPVAKNRTGHCSGCGKCCYLPSKCLFLKIKNGKNYCSIYKIRPLNCRKYPRTEAECLTKSTCSYHFD